MADFIALPPEKPRGFMNIMDCEPLRRRIAGAAAISDTLPIILADAAILVSWLVFLSYEPKRKERFHEE